ncbi:CPBP family intramembrane glutamic endopeptidase [Bifidobacterium scaligerum]|nr:CPBP family intramembrane glutamic endopeptidase [Bifidobacterium scaligerum]
MNEQQPGQPQIPVPAQPSQWDSQENQRAQHNQGQQSSQYATYAQAGLQSPQPSMPPRTSVQSQRIGQTQQPIYIAQSDQQLYGRPVPSPQYGGPQYSYSQPHNPNPYGSPLPVVPSVPAYPHGSAQYYQPQPQTQLPSQPQPYIPYWAAVPVQPIDLRKAWRTWRRKVTNRAMGLTLAYQGMMYVGAIAASIMALIANSVTGKQDTGTSWDGIISLVSVITAFGFLLLMRHRDIITREFWLGGSHMDTYGEPNQRGRISQYGGSRMRPLWFLAFIALGLGVQGVVTLVQLAFAMVGADLASPTSESINESAVTVSMWLYIGLVGPICEEVLFRGVLMKELKPLGRNFAIVTSALVFGLFHDDVVQGTFAFLFGLILGFVAMEYSLVWSIALHVFNNAILSGVIDTWLAGYLDSTGYAIYSIALALIGVIGALIVFAFWGRGLRQYRRDNRSVSGTYAAWACPTFVIFVVINAVMAVLSFAAAMIG